MILRLAAIVMAIPVIVAFIICGSRFEVFEVCFIKNSTCYLLIVPVDSTCYHVAPNCGSTNVAPKVSFSVLVKFTILNIFRKNPFRKHLPIVASVNTTLNEKTGRD